MRRIDLTGKRFGKLIIVGVSHFDKKCLKWICKCDCGKTSIVIGNNLLRGTTQSCGCSSRTRDGYSNGENKATYKAWASMIGRCYNENFENYPIYGGRGIIVCDRWRGETGFKNFLEDMGLRPSKNHSLDRFPNNETGIYEPTNCRWGTREEQERNKRTNRWFEYNGKKMIIQDWAKELGVSRSVIYKMMGDISK